MEKKKIYVGCALSHAPKEFIDFIFDLKRSIESISFEVLHFGWQEHTGPAKDKNVYDIDVSNVDNADYFVAICDYPSIGLGIEIERAFTSKTPTVAFVKKGKYLSQIVPNGLSSHKMTEPTEYETKEDILKKIKEVCV